jgi:hypothetical protein
MKGGDRGGPVEKMILLPPLTIMEKEGKRQSGFYQGLSVGKVRLSVRCARFTDAAAAQKAAEYLVANVAAFFTKGLWGKESKEAGWDPVWSFDEQQEPPAVLVRSGDVCILAAVLPSDDVDVERAGQREAVVAVVRAILKKRDEALREEKAKAAKESGLKASTDVPKNP